METCNPQMEEEEEEEGLQPSAPLRLGEGAAWCEWSPRARPGPSTTPWWLAPPRAPPAQMRAPPTARTLTLPSWTRTTCEQAEQPSLPPSLPSSYVISHSEDALHKSKTDLGSEGGISRSSCRLKVLHMWTVTHPVTNTLYSVSLPVICATWLLSELMLYAISST